MGQPLGHGLRSCAVALRLGALAGFSDEDLRATYYVVLLRWIGCTADAHELAAIFGDEVAARARSATVDVGDPLSVARTMITLVPGTLPAKIATLIRARGELASGSAVHCAVATRLAERLGCDDAVRRALGDVFERWDGRGGPRGLRGSDIALAARTSVLARDLEIFHRLGGTEAVTEVARSRARRAYDPELAEIARRYPVDLFDGLDAAAARAAVIAAEPSPSSEIAPDALDDVLAVIADFTDLKVPAFAGHSRGVAALAHAAALRRGLPGADAEALRRAGLIHDLGRVGIGDGVWERPGALSEGERDAVQLHPYYTERVLMHGALAQFGAIAARHHERLDGSGYHRGARVPDLPVTARLLAAADCYHAMREARPHRPALDESAAVRILREEAQRGRLEAESVEAVLDALGGRHRERASSTLTDREIEVLRLLARGLTNRKIGERLGISAATVHHHVLHLYEKASVSSRAAATLYAMERGLLG
jgi:HD-GYP domain-containing protein (c-di-GMP phosphodiesterase class II)